MYESLSMQLRVYVKGQIKAERRGSRKSSFSAKRRDKVFIILSLHKSSFLWISKNKTNTVILCYQKRSEFHQNDDGHQQGLEGAPVAPYHKIKDWFNIWYLSNLTVHVIFSLKRCWSGFESLLPHILCFEHCGKKVFSVSSLPEQCPSCRWGSSPS